MNIPIEEVLEELKAIRKEQQELKSLILEKLNGETDEWWDLNKLERYLPEKLARATLYAKLAKGEFPGHKRGKKWYFLKSEIDQWLKQGRRKTVAEIANEADNYLSNKKRLNNGKY